jgi:DNA-directed RNA polymerase specialized sigma24 family protein
MKRLGLWKPPEIDWERVRGAGIAADDMLELRTIYRLVHDMPVELRVPLVLKHVEDKSLQEIADLVGVSIATAKRRIAKAQEQLAVAMGRRSDVRELSEPKPRGVAAAEEEHDRQAPRVASAGRHRDG